MHPNKSLVFKKFTPGWPVPGENLTVETRPFDPEAQPPAGGITVKNIYLSLDPYQRGQMRLPTDTGTYSSPWIEDQPAVVTTLSKVLKSDHPDFKPGDEINAMANASEYAAIPAEYMCWARIHPDLPKGTNFPSAASVGALGVAGMAAYFSFFEFIPEARTGKTIFISAASGGVGQLVGQLAKMDGMKVIGSTSSYEKAEFVRSLGFDASWNYKTEKTADALKRLAPEGLDYYYDNVGGEQFETALLFMKDFGTVVLSGMISQYNVPTMESYGIRTTQSIVTKRLTVHGFICSDSKHIQCYMSSFTKNMVSWIAEGKIKTREEVITGIENGPDAMVKMLKGDKFGKMVLKVNERD